MGLIEIGTALWVREQERQLEREKKKFREDDEENGLLYFPRLIYSGGGGMQQSVAVAFWPSRFMRKFIGENSFESCLFSLVLSSTFHIMADT